MTNDEQRGSAVRCAELRRFHLEHGATLVELSGYATPLHYGSVADEHLACRAHAAMFDVSHMGRFQLTGAEVETLLERACARRLADTPPGACRYTVICNEAGGIKDDAIVYRLEDRWLVVCSAVCRQKIAEHLGQVGDGVAVSVEDIAETTAMLAFQGPRAMALLGRVMPEVSALQRFRFARKRLSGWELLVSRTGYTGEDGVEILCAAADLARLLALLASAGGGQIPFTPAGLAARCTLRLEAGLPLYGYELTEDIDPLSAGLHRAVSLDKEASGRGDAFIGQTALRRIAEEGPRHRLVGLRVAGDESPPPNVPVCAGGEQIGRVSSGVLFLPTAPTLGYPAALAFVDAPWAAPGRDVEVDFGDRRAEGRIVKLPFYARPR